MTEVIKFESMHDLVIKLEDYFKSNPAIIHDTDAKIYFQHNFYYLILNKFDWSQDD